MMRRLHSRRGLGMIELLIAVLLAGFLTLAVGVIYLASIEAWRNGQIKLTLQQEVTRVQEQVSRDVRGSRRIDSPSAGELYCYDADDAQIVYYEYDSVTDELSRNGIPIMDYDCIGVTFDTTAERNAVRLLLEFQDPNDTVVRIASTAMMRNLDLGSY
jgi:type II secretory pathway pseudopilin PulG